LNRQGRGKLVWFDRGLFRPAIPRGLFDPGRAPVSPRQRQHRKANA
jgi:hypothetical protein